MERGEVFGCLGPNSAGKTTAMRMVPGLVRQIGVIPAAGWRQAESAFVHGMDLALLVSAVLAGAGLVIALLVIPLRTPAPSGRERAAGGPTAEGAVPG